jgi:transposase-like protein
MTRQQSLHLKKRFLEHFAEYGNVSAAARHAGIERNTVYQWQERDDTFVAAFREAEIKATEVLEGEARRRAVEGVTQEVPIYFKGQAVDTIVKTEYSDTLLIFLLKARAPEKYRERHDVNVTSQPVAVAYELADVDLLR